MHNRPWKDELREWLGSRGLEVVAFDNHYPRAGIYMADGWTNRETAHMTVWRGIEMIHDPHESRSGLDNIRCTYWVMPCDLTP